MIYHDPGELVGVGVGPGVANLVTLAAIEALETSQIVVAPCTDLDTPGRAETTVRGLLPDISIERLAIPMGSDPTGAYQKGCQKISTWLDLGHKVSFITLGDPNIYSTFSSISTHLLEIRPNSNITTVPGIMAFQYLAAKTNTVLVDGNERLSLVTALDQIDNVRDCLERADDCVVVYKGGKHFGEITNVLEEVAPRSLVVVGELLGLEEESIESSLPIQPRPYNYLSTMIISHPTRAKIL